MSRCLESLPGFQGFQPDTEMRKERSLLVHCTVCQGMTASERPNGQVLVQRDCHEKFQGGKRRLQVDSQRLQPERGPSAHGAEADGQDGSAGRCVGQGK